MVAMNMILFVIFVANYQSSIKESIPFPTRIEGHKESFSGSILFKRCCWLSVDGLELRTMIICLPVATFLLFISGSFGGALSTSNVGEAARSIIDCMKCV